MRILTITGAGISVAAGGHTYRGPGGLYENDTTLPDVISTKGLKEDPRQVVEQLLDWRDQTYVMKPTKAHDDLAHYFSMARHDMFLLTQNVDGLHDKNGIHRDSMRCLEIHGNLNQDVRMDNDEMRPDVVLFGDSIDNRELARAIQFTAKGVDLVLVVGTTLSFSYLTDLIAHSDFAATYLNNRKPYKVLVDSNTNHKLKDKFDAFYSDKKCMEMIPYIIDSAEQTLGLR